MSRRTLSVWLIALLLHASGTARAEERQTHVVAAGEVLGTIARRYGVAVADLQTWNELSGDRIRVGQSLLVSPEVPEAHDTDALATWRTTYVVQRGDHLGRIAERVGVSVASLREANPQMRLDRLRPGQRLEVVGPTRVVDHVVRRGETVARLCSRYEVRPLDLTEWNPSLRRRGLEVGMTLRIYTDVRISRSESVGAPNEGLLEHGEPLPEHRAYVVRTGERSFGTHETVQWLVEAFDAALDADPRMPRVRVHDLSRAEGGRLTGHRSHQSGRDADVAYYRRQCRENETCFMNTTRPEDLAVAHQWRLFRYWLERDLAANIFVDYALQEPLYQYARSHGASTRDLERWFQYPRGASVPVGVIRHFAGHADHFHVRFVCPRGDDRCSEPVRRAAPPSRQAPPDTDDESDNGEVLLVRAASEPSAPQRAERGEAAPAPDEGGPSEAPAAPAAVATPSETTSADRPESAIIAARGESG